MSTEPEARSAVLVQDLFAVRDLGVVVTGAGSGLGLAMATALARNGARVTLADVDAARLRAASTKLAGHGCDVRTAVVDVADADEVEAMTAAAAAWGGGLHVVFANAGISAGPGLREEAGRLGGIDRSRWDRVLEVNLTGVLHTVQSAARHLTSGYGRIVVTSSMAGIRADPLVGYAYTASKAAVVALVRNAAVELAPRGILVNAIAPGAFVTNIGSDNPQRARSVEEFRRASLLGRLADSSEIAGLALFLASAASGYVTGAVLPIDGGATTTRTPS